MLKHYAICSGCGNDFVKEESTSETLCLMCAEINANSTEPESVDHSGMTVVYGSEFREHGITGQVQQKRRGRPRKYPPKPTPEPRPTKCELCGTPFTVKEGIAGRKRKYCEECASRLQDSVKKQEEKIMAQKICIDCTEPFTATSNCQRRCPKCQSLAKNVAYQRLQKGANRVVVAEAATASPPAEVKPDKKTESLVAAPASASSRTGTCAGYHDESVETPASAPDIDYSPVIGKVPSSAREQLMAAAKLLVAQEHCIVHITITDKTDWTFSE